MSSLTERDLTPSEMRYLCGLFYYTLQEELPVSNGDLATALDVSGASVTEMFETFAEKDLIVYEPYQGARLTDAGEQLARATVWRWCATQQFFEQHGIDVDTDTAHAIAYTLSTHSVSQISDQVGQPCDGHCQATDVDECTPLQSVITESPA